MRKRDKREESWLPSPVMRVPYLPVLRTALPRPIDGAPLLKFPAKPWSRIARDNPLQQVEAASGRPFFFTARADLCRCTYVKLIDSSIELG
jgi:hypothetical protein